MLGSFCILFMWSEHSKNIILGRQTHIEYVLWWQSKGGKSRDGNEMILIQGAIMNGKQLITSWSEAFCSGIDVSATVNMLLCWM
jgi:hypothetical protein